MNYTKKWFTLLEIMIVIALIWIIALWASKINFNSLSDRQRVDGFFYKIKTNIETIQNDALIWKAIKLPDNSVIVPKKWKIDFSNSWSWIIVNNYFDWNNYKKYSGIKPDKFYEIIIKNNNTNLIDTWSLLIEWWNLSLTWITSNNKILEIEAKYKNFSKIFIINTISWVIEEK